MNTTTRDIMLESSRLLGPARERIHGCGFCGSITEYTTTTGNTIYHQSRECCPEMLVLEMLWRYSEALHHQQRAHATHATKQTQLMIENCTQELSQLRDKLTTTFDAERILEAFITVRAAPQAIPYAHVLNAVRERTQPYLRREITPE